MKLLIETGGQFNRWDWEDPSLTGPHRAAMAKADSFGTYEDRTNLARLDTLHARAIKHISVLPLDLRCVYLNGFDLLGYTVQARRAMLYQTTHLANALVKAGCQPLIYLDCEAESKTLSGAKPANEWSYRASVLTELMAPLSNVGCRWFNYVFGRTSPKVPTVAWWGGPCVNVRCGHFNSVDFYAMSWGGGQTGYTQRLKNLASSIATDIPTIPDFPCLWSERDQNDLNVWHEVQPRDAALRQTLGVIDAAAARCPFAVLSVYMWPESDHANLLAAFDAKLAEVNAGA